MTSPDSLPSVPTQPIRFMGHPVYAPLVSRPKRHPHDFALWGGEALFAEIRSASNLVQPDPESVLRHVRQSYDGGCLSHGICVTELERRLAEVHRVDHCIAMCNGLWAIVMCLQCLKLPGRTQVVMPSLTYRRLADIAAWVGLTPHFCDVCPHTLAVTAETILPCLNSQTAALLIAHPIVHVCDVESIERLAEECEIPLVFDAVEAAHASHQGRMLGSFGNAECYSMHASKFLNGFEAGYITTNDSQLANTLRRLMAPESSGSIESRSAHDAPDEIDPRDLKSFNGRLSEVHAAMALASLQDLSAQIERNRTRHLKYQAVLMEVSGCDLVCYEATETRTFKNALVMLNDDWPLSRAQTIELLHAENLLVRPYYSPPLHLKSTSYETMHASLPVTERLADRYLLLPSGEFVSLSDIDQIGQLMRSIQQMSGALRRQFLLTR